MICISCKQLCTLWHYQLQSVPLEEPPIPTTHNRFPFILYVQPISHLRWKDHMSIIVMQQETFHNNVRLHRMDLTAQLINPQVIL